MLDWNTCVCVYLCVYLCVCVCVRVRVCVRACVRSCRVWLRPPLDDDNCALLSAIANAGLAHLLLARTKRSASRCRSFLPPPAAPCRTMAEINPTESAKRCAPRINNPEKDDDDKKQSRKRGPEVGGSDGGSSSRRCNVEIHLIIVLLNGGVCNGCVGAHGTACPCDCGTPEQRDDLSAEIRTQDRGDGAWFRCECRRCGPPEQDEEQVSEGYWPHGDFPYYGRRLAPGRSRRFFR